MPVWSNRFEEGGSGAMLLTWQLCTTVMCFGGVGLLAWFTTESLFRPGIRQDDSTS